MKKIVLGKAKKGEINVYDVDVNTMYTVCENHGCPEWEIGKYRIVNLAFKKYYAIPVFDYYGGWSKDHESLRDMMMYYKSIKSQKVFYTTKSIKKFRKWLVAK